MATRTGGLAVALMVVAAFAVGFTAQALLGGRAVLAQEAPDGEFRVRRLAVVDDGGVERAVLEVASGDTDGVGLALFDSEGRRRVLLGGAGLLEPDVERYWSLGFFDAEGWSRLGWSVREDGLSCGGHMSDPGQVVRIGIGAGEDGAGIGVNDSSGRQCLGIGVGPEGDSDFVVMDRLGNDAWRAVGELTRRAVP